MRLNVRRILFIVLCAEALLVYWSKMELYEMDRRELLTGTPSEIGFKPQAANKDHKDM